MILEEMRIETIRAMGDNFIHLATVGDAALVVDPGVAEPVLDKLREKGLDLELILVTHGHFDHTGGCEDLRAATGCRVAGPIDAADEAVVDGGSILFGGLELEALATPGHTRADYCYFERESHSLFTGDTLFLCGCGRVFGGETEEMWNSLRRLRELPDQARVYCGHDYTRENLEFALTVEPGNESLRERSEREKANPQCWSTMEEEKATNPFLRPESALIRATLEMADATDAAVFARLRAMKDRFCVND